MTIGAVFFDRDDTLVKDTGYMYKIADFQWMDGAISALLRLHTENIPIFIATNQGGIGKSLFTLAQMHAFHDHLQEQARTEGIQITDIAFCPHHPEAVIAELAQPCSCRKPEPGMLETLAQKWQIDLGASVMIGDKLSDMQAGERAGCHALQLTADTNLPELADIAIKIIRKASA